MDTTLAVFFGLAIVAVVATIGVVTAARIMHAALWMGLAFVAVAGVYLVLNADFLAAAQVLVYVGAITTIIVFGIMLSEAADIVGRRTHPSVETSSVWRRGIIPLVVTGLFTALMVGVYLRTGWRGPMPAQVLEDTTHAIGTALFRDFVIPFELAAILLLVALVGAIVMASKEESN